MHTITELQAKVEAVKRGEITLAQLQGMTAQHAHMISKIGCELAAAGRLEEARVVFSGLVASNPKDAVSFAALGTVLQKLGRLSDALAAYDRAVELDSQNAIALANRGELRLKSGDRAGLDDLNRAVSADPEGKSVASRRARDLIKVIAQFVQITRPPLQARGG